MMDKAVYVVGTLHRYQGCSRASKTALEQFRAFLKRLICDHDIRSVAEEMSIEALERFPHPDVPPGKSILFQIATELGIPHQYSDPNSAIQEQLGILHLPKAKNGYAREAYWLRQLRDLHLFPCLFVLGVCHTRSFPNLLATSGFKPIVLTKEWKP
jgi:hypothetical protein